MFSQRYQLLLYKDLHLHVQRRRHHFDSGVHNNAASGTVCTPTCDILAFSVGTSVATDAGNRISTEVLEPNQYCSVPLYLAGFKSGGGRVGTLYPHTPSCAIHV